MQTPFRGSRTLLLIGAIAFTAIVAVGLIYGLTESARLAVAADGRQMIDLLQDDARLVDSINREEEAVDAYMMSAAPETLSVYRDAAAAELAAATDMASRAGALPGVRVAVAGTAASTQVWRATFAEPAIGAVDAGGGLRLAPYLQGSADDTATIHAAITAVSSELAVAEGDLLAREDAVTVTRTAGTVLGLALLGLALLIALLLVHRYGREHSIDAWRAGVLNRFTEVSAFAPDDSAVAIANLEAISLLVHPDAAVTHVLNHSQDRATPAATTGDPVAEVLPLQALSSCAGMIRGSMYVASDLAAPLTVHCPVYPAERGTLACIPLLSSDTIGSIHLYWAAPDALPLERRRDVGQIAEHAALAIGSRRLLAALRSQAGTDARTGLANSRTFDQALEEALGERTSDESVAVLMLDLDHFKDFNDRHGHPAGDEALRTFGSVLQSCMREGDIAARYGGEEFAVALPGVGHNVAAEIAERIRARTESTILSLAPGITDRITVSIGVAMAPAQGLDRVTLLRAADEALYRAKDQGRNRVVSTPSHAVRPAA